MGLHPRCRQQNVSFSLPCRMVHLLFLCSFVVSTESDRDEPKHAGDLAGTRDELCSKENASLSRYGTLQVDPTSDLIMQSVVMPESEQQRQRVIAFNFDPIISPYGVFAKDEFESKAARFSERSNDELSDKEDFTAPKSEDVANGTPVHERAMDAAKIEEMQVAEDSVNLQGSSEDSSEISDDIRTANGMQQTEAEILAEEADDTRALLDGEHVARESLSNSLRAESTTDEKSNIQLEESISSDMPPTKPGKRELSSDVAKESIQNEGNNTDSYELYENVGGLDEKKVSDSGTTDVAGTEAVAVDEQEGDSMTQEDNLLLQNSTEITQTFDAENDPSGEVDQVLPIGTDTPIISHAGDLDIAGSKDTGRGEEAVTSQLDMDSESTDEQEDVVIPPRNNASEIVGQNNVEALSLSDKKEELAEEDNNTQASASNVVEDFQKGESNPPSSKNATNGASDDSSNVKSITQPYGANVTSTSGAGESKSFTEEMSLVQSTNNVSSEDIDAEQTESGKEINGVIEKGDTENEKRTGEEGVIRDSSLLIELEVEEESTENVLKEGDTFDRYEESIPGEMTHEGEGSLHNTSPNEENTRDISQKQTLDIGQSDVSTATKNDRSEGDTPIINSAHIDFGGTSVKGSLEGLPGANEDSEATSTDLLEFSETESLGSPGKDGAPEFEATTLSIEDESILSDSASALKSPSKSASYDTVSTEETIPNTKDFSGGSKKPSVNDEFVLGLDDLHKFVEEVDPPDELDVGAAGSSMQEVLMGQGVQILKKRASMGVQHVRRTVAQLKRKAHGHSYDENERRPNDIGVESGNVDFERRGGPFNFAVVEVEKNKERLGKASRAIRRACKRYAEQCRSIIRNIFGGGEDFEEDDDVSDIISKLDMMKSSTENRRRDVLQGDSASASASASNTQKWKVDSAKQSDASSRLTPEELQKLVSRSQEYSRNTGIATSGKT